jgi:hypothetical protein
VRTAQRWYATAGRGDGALLADHLAAALDGDTARLDQVLAAARRDRDPEIEVLTLDVLALLHASEGRTREARSLRAEADRLMPAARHLMTDADRSAMP